MKKQLYCPLCDKKMWCTFIGDQLGINDEYKFSLYNCDTCHDTMAYVDKNKTGGDNEMTKKHITVRIDQWQLACIKRIIAKSKGKIETLSHFIRLAISEKIDREIPKRDARKTK